MPPAPKFTMMEAGCDSLPVAPRPHQPRGMTELGALRVVDSAKWARTVKRALKAHGGRTADAAEELGISVRQLFRWLGDPLLADVKRLPAGRRPAEK